MPKAGIDLSTAFCKQRVREVTKGVYGKSTPLGNNVRAFEALTNRFRGGQRAGLVKYIAAPVVAGWLLQELAVIVSTSAGAVG